MELHVNQACYSRYITIIIAITTCIIHLVSLLRLCHVVNPVAHRKAKTVYDFGLSECNSVKQIYLEAEFSVFQGKIMLIIFRKNSHFSISQS